MIRYLTKQIRRRCDPIELLQCLKPDDRELLSLVHVGAHLAQERFQYEARGYRKVLWIEGSAGVHQRLQEIIAHHDGTANHTTTHALLTDVDDSEAELRAYSNDGMSSSIFPPTESFETRFAGVKQTEQRELNRTITLDTLLRGTPFEDDCDVLVVDVQGAELLVLKGSTDTLSRVSAVICEVSTQPYYEGGVLFEELNAFLESQGFEAMAAPRRHGDMLFLKKEITKASFHPAGSFADPAANRSTTRTTMLQTARAFLRPLPLIGCSLRGKLNAYFGIRKPAKSCQVPALQSLVDSYIPPEAPGVFVEVGAYDGERFSNTSWLADHGWRGIYVEPSRQFAAWCRLRHWLNRVEVVNMAAGDAESEATLMQVGPLSTISSETFDEYDRMEWARKMVKKSCQAKTTRIDTLDHILESRKIQPGFDMLVVDVEGYEENVFKGFDLHRWQPTLMIVELCDIHPSFSNNVALVESAARVRNQIRAAGYEEIYSDKINTVFHLPHAISTQADRSAAA